MENQPQAQGPFPPQAPQLQPAARSRLVPALVVIIVALVVALLVGGYYVMNKSSVSSSDHAKLSVPSNLMEEKCIFEFTTGDKWLQEKKGESSGTMGGDRPIIDTDKEGWCYGVPHEFDNSKPYVVLHFIPYATNEEQTAHPLAFSGIDLVSKDGDILQTIKTEINTTQCCGVDDNFSDENKDGYEDITTGSETYLYNPQSGLFARETVPQAGPLQTYRNDSQGFSFQYPASLSISFNGGQEEAKYQVLTALQGSANQTLDGLIALYDVDSSKISTKTIAGANAKIIMFDQDVPTTVGLVIQLPTAKVKNGKSYYFLTIDNLPPSAIDTITSTFVLDR